MNAYSLPGAGEQSLLLGYKVAPDATDGALSVSYFARPVTLDASDEFLLAFHALIAADLRKLREMMAR